MPDDKQNPGGNSGPDAPQEEPQLGWRIEVQALPGGLVELRICGRMPASGAAQIAKLVMEAAKRSHAAQPIIIPPARPPS